MYVLAFSVNETDSGPSAPDLTFHSSVNAAEAELRQLASIDALESNDEVRIEIEDVDGDTTKYRFFDTGVLHGEEEALFYVATIGLVR